MYKFKNLEIKSVVFSHPSVESDTNKRYFFQKLELMGDRLINMYLSKFIFNSSKDESEMSLKLSILVSKNLMSKIGKFLIKKTNFIGQSSEKIITDCLECYIGGIFFDKGNVEKIIFQLWKKYLDIKAIKPIKTQLQEKSKVKYTIINHKDGFLATCFTNNQNYEGFGKSKKEATRIAAEKALKQT